MVGLVIKWFQENELLRFLFPLYCPDIHEKLPSDKFECPARTPGIVQRGSTIAIGSTESGWAGAHGEVVKLDDFENEKNTATQDLRQARIDDFDDLDPVVEPGGYVDVLGTLWGEDDDLYCELIKRNAKWIAEGHDPEMLIVKQPVWKLKPGVELKKVKEEDIEWVIWEKLNLGNLIKQARANPHKFSRQYLMEVLPSEVKSFNLAMLQRQIRPASELPQPHRCWSFQNWDLAGTSNKPGVDKSVGYNVFFDDLGEMFAVDCVSERFSTPTELATAIVMLAKQWKPVKIRIEESLGARNLEPTIIAIAKREKVNVPIIWVPPVKEKNAKINRISLLEPGLKTNKIKFLAGLPYIDVLFEQLMHHPNYSGRRHDDEADCLAQLWEYFKDKVYSISILEMQPDPEELFIFRTRDSHLRSDDRVEIKNTEEECIDGLPNVLSEGLFG
jgi:predicted phage terminase large subunit-like protein